MKFSKAEEKKIERGMKELAKMPAWRRRALELGVSFVQIFETDEEDKRLLARAQEAFNRMKVREVV